MSLRAYPTSFDSEDTMISGRIPCSSKYAHTAFHVLCVSLAFLETSNTKSAVWICAISQMHRMEPSPSRTTSTSDQFRKRQSPCPGCRRTHSMISWRSLGLQNEMFTAAPALAICFRDTQVRAWCLPSAGQAVVRLHMQKQPARRQPASPPCSLWCRTARSCSWTARPLP